MLHTHAYEVVFTTPSGETHKSVIQHHSTWLRNPVQVKALDEAVRRFVTDAKIGVEIISLTKIEASAVELRHARAISGSVIDTAFGELTEFDDARIV
jgi:hypothetical protein